MRPSELPVPPPQAIETSEALRARIVGRIERAGGWIGFDEFMNAALYEPGLGYYSGGSRKFGREGDFVTAPETSPLFGACLAAQCAQWFEHVPARIVEFGAGSGALAVALLEEFQRLGIGPVDYRIVEVSAELRERQRESLQANSAKVASQVSWLERWPDAIEGVVIGNELLDAMPARVFRLDRGRVFERGVGVGSEGFGWRDRGADPDFAREVRAVIEGGWRGGEESEEPDPGDRGYVSEIGIQAQSWVREAGRRLERGALLLIDYGFPRGEFYHPQRSGGTLMCHYRHLAHPDPFLWPGLQDITVHVDFTGVARAAADAGLAPLGYATQAHFLINLGLIDRLSTIPAERAAHYLPQAKAVRRLVSEDEMGELFKAIAFGRGMPDDAIGFARGDRRMAL